MHFSRRCGHGIEGRGRGKRENRTHVRIRGRANGRPRCWGLPGSSGGPGVAGASGRGRRGPDRGPARLREDGDRPAGGGERGLHGCGPNRSGHDPGQSQPRARRRRASTDRRVADRPGDLEPRPARRGRPSREGSFHPHRVGRSPGRHHAPHRRRPNPPAAPAPHVALRTRTRQRPGVTRERAGGHSRLPSGDRPVGPPAGRTDLRRWLAGASPILNRGRPPRESGLRGRHLPRRPPARGRGAAGSGARPSLPPVAGSKTSPPTPPSRRSRATSPAPTNRR